MHDDLCTGSSPSSIDNITFCLSHHGDFIIIPTDKKAKPDRPHTHSRVMKNFVCITDASESVVTVPLATSKPKSLRALICGKLAQIHRIMTDYKH